MGSTAVCPTKPGTKEALPFFGEWPVRVARRSDTMEEHSESFGTQVLTRDTEIVRPVPGAILGAVQNTKPIQIWEGVVLTVDRERSQISAKLRARSGEFPEHTASFNFQWIPDQDMDLVIPGAVFYLTLFRKIKRGTIENTQELRFRRLPSWSNMQVRKVYEAADILEKGMSIGKRLDGD